MKKFMIAAAIVCAAALAQASSVTWTCTKVYAEGTETGISGIAYLFAGSDYSSAGIVSALEEKGADAVNAWLNGVSDKYTTAVASGTMTDMTTKPDATLLGLSADGTKQTLYALIFDTATVTDASNFYVVEKANTVPKSGNALFAFGSQATASAAAGAWHAVAPIPEPTSGILLLVGGALLTLRRKRS